MFARKRPLTRPHNHGPSHDQDLDDPVSRQDRRGSYDYFRRQPWLSRIMLHLRLSKDDPLAWLMLVFVVSFLMAGATLIDRDVFHGSTSGPAAVTAMRNSSIAVEKTWKSWSPFTFTLENTTETHPRSTIHTLQSIHPKLRPTSSSSIPRDKHGLRVLTLDQEFKAREHPIATLIREAEKKADQLDAKISSIRTLSDAEADYRSAFGMEPPRGFRKWYEFASKRSCITAPSLLSEAHLSVRPYLAYKPSLLRQRMDELVEKNKGTWYFDLGKRQGLGSDRRNKIQIGGGAVGDFRAHDVFELINPILPYIPDQLAGEDDLRLVFSVHDGPMAQSDWSLMDISRELAEAGLVWDETTLAAKEEQQQRHAYGWSMVCDPDSHLSRASKDRILNHEVAQNTSSLTEKSFIEDHVATYDYCHNPSLSKQHGMLIVNDRGPSPMVPVISYCKTTHNNDIMGVALDAMNKTLPAMAWKEKTIDKVVWRGSFTGAFHGEQFHWRNSQRERMVTLANNREDHMMDVLVQQGRKLKRKEYSLESLNERFLDIEPVGGAVQVSSEPRVGSNCQLTAAFSGPSFTCFMGAHLFASSHPKVCDQMLEEFTFGDMMTPETALKYKYTVDIDGNGWSSRFRRLLTSSSVILKSTIFPEWNSDILIPWYHYVPLKVDYSDLYDIMVYFAGSPDGQVKGHDDQAARIAQRGRAFAVDRWRWEDMQSYMLLTILEYQRVLSRDRQALDVSQIQDDVHARWKEMS
ncbi:hypothetical protein NliqN6_0449 [Naganishia liquefaciens]|uniref:Glycosyl transferase CAP10 domain-containing protein n=1 Tax=Naganishia liquefaciens TaxID=104408 RepID=A0A8H3TMW7_9TREE|nr:hypothetical protein NliqN6_0449 [Naganishia liquefaciens]